jgi:hypothetical protein
VTGRKESFFYLQTNAQAQDAIGNQITQLVQNQIMSTDIDHVNMLMSMTFLLLFPTLEFASLQHRNRMQRFDARTGPRWVEMEGSVQLTIFPPLFIRQSQHHAVIRQLQERGVYVAAPEYVRFDSGHLDANRDMSPVAFSRTTRGIESAQLVDALIAAGVDTVRLVQFNQKLDLNAFVETHWEHKAVGAGDCVFDISTNVTIGDGQPGVPLVCATVAPDATRPRGTVAVQPLLGFIGHGHGSVHCGPIQVARGVLVHTLIVYPASLVHGLKMNGAPDDVPPHSTVTSAGKARRELVKFAERYCLDPDERRKLMEGTLRFEVRVIVDPEQFDGTLYDLANLVAVDSLKGASELYLDKLVFTGCFVSEAEYEQELRVLIGRINDEKYRVGFHSRMPEEKKDEKSINAVLLRLCDFIAQMGIFPNEFRLKGCVARALTWTWLNPSEKEVNEGGSIFDLHEIVEPDAPTPPPPVERSRRYFVVPISGEPTEQTKRKIVDAVHENDRLASAGQPTRPIMISRTLPTGAIARLYSDHIARNWDVIEETPAEEQLTAEETLRMRMDVMLRITEGRWQRKHLRRHNRIEINAATREDVLNIMMEQHQHDWLEFDLNTDYHEYQITRRDIRAGQAPPPPRQRRRTTRQN